MLDFFAERVSSQGSAVDTKNILFVIFKILLSRELLKSERKKFQQKIRIQKISCTRILQTYDI